MKTYLNILENLNLNGYRGIIEMLINDDCNKGIGIRMC